MTPKDLTLLFLILINVENLLSLKTNLQFFGIEYISEILFLNLVLYEICFSRLLHAPAQDLRWNWKQSVLELSNPFNFGHKLYFLVNQSKKFIACFLVLNWIIESSVFFL